jgi:hypothetical protein
VIDQAIESRNAQLVFIGPFAKTECGVTFDSTVLAELFELTRSRLRAIRAKAQRKQRSLYRSPALFDEQECQIIQEKAVTGNCVSKRELIKDIEVNFHTSLIYRWINCALQHWADDGIHD